MMTADGCLCESYILEKRALIKFKRRTFFLLPSQFSFDYLLQKTETSRDGETCNPHREDYFECLHHKKEHAIVKRINEEMAAKTEKENGH